MRDCEFAKFLARLPLSLFINEVPLAEPCRGGKKLPDRLIAESRLVFEKSYLPKDQIASSDQN